MMTIDEMRNKLDKFCEGFDLCGDGCPLRKPDGSCRWNNLSDKSTEDCYHFLSDKSTEDCYHFLSDKSTEDCYHFLSDKSAEDCYHFLGRLIGKPEQPEINFVKVERNDEVEQTNDAVQHPSHYTQGGIECIDAIRASMTVDGFCDYCKGNIIKYIWRWRDKGGVEDLRKASVYLEWLINAADEKEKKGENGK